MSYIGNLYNEILNRIKFSIFKRQVLRNTDVHTNSNSISNNTISVEISKRALEDSEIVSKLIEKKQIVYLTQLLPYNNDVLNFLVANDSKLDVIQLLQILERFKSKEDFTSLFQSSIGRRLSENNPNYVYQHTAEMTHQELQEIGISRAKLIQNFYNQNGKQIDYEELSRIFSNYTLDSADRVDLFKYVYGNGLNQPLDGQIKTNDPNSELIGTTFIQYLEKNFSVEENFEILKICPFRNDILITNYFLEANIDDSKRVEMLKQLQTLDLRLFEYIQNFNVSDTLKLELFRNLEIRNFDNSSVNTLIDEKYIGALREKINNSTELQNELENNIFSKIDSNFRIKNYGSSITILNMISMYGIENLDKISNKMSVDQKKELEYYIQVSKGFSTEEKYIICGFDNKHFSTEGFYGMHFSSRYKEATINPNNNFRKILDIDGNFNQFKNYLKLRKIHLNLDDMQSFTLAINEYYENHDVIKDILFYSESILSQENLSLEEQQNKLTEISYNLNFFMENKDRLKLKSFEDFQNMEEYETLYYESIGNEIQSSVQSKDNSSRILRTEIVNLLVPERNFSYENISSLQNPEILKKTGLMEVYQLLHAIHQIDDFDTLQGIFDDLRGLIGSNELNEFRKMTSNMEEKIISKYREAYTTEITPYEKMTIEQLKEVDGIKAYEVDGVKVIELNGAPFNFVGHQGNFKGQRLEKEVCSSYVTNELYNTIGNQNMESFFVFGNIEGEQIRMVGTGDSGFDGYDGISKKYHTPEDLIALTTTEDTVSKGHNASYNEIKLNWFGGRRLLPTAIVTKASNGTPIFLKRIEQARRLIGNKSDQQPTLYVFNEEVYEHQIEQKQEVSNRKALIEKYLTTFNANVLGELLIFNRKIDNRVEILSQIKDFLEGNGIPQNIDISEIQKAVVKFTELKERYKKESLIHQISSVLCERYSERFAELSKNSKIFEVTDTDFGLKPDIKRTVQLLNKEFKDKNTGSER